MFVLDSDDKQNTINDFVETQHSINVISFVFYEHDQKRSWNQFLSFRDRFWFHSITWFITTWATITTLYNFKPYFSLFHLVVVSDSDSNMRFFRKFYVIRRLILLISISLSSRYKIIKRFDSSIFIIQHSLFDLIFEKIHQKAYLLICIIFHWWCRIVDFAFLYLKNWFLDFERSFLHLRSRKHWYERILKSTTIWSLWFRSLFHFFD